MIFFIIPAYNEEENIESLLSGLASKMKDLKIAYHVILVNDGSTDATYENAATFRGSISLDIISHLTNKGVGEVFRTGFSRALELASDDDIIVTKEADNTSDLNILSAMLKKLEEGYDLVLASCYAKGGGIIGTTIDRVILSFCANFILRTLFSIKNVRTYSSFYRAYKAGMLKKANFAYADRLIEDSGFTCMVELLVRLKRLGIKITEVPMILRCDFRKGLSKMKKMETMKGYFSLISKEIACDSNRINGIVKRYENYVKK